MHSEDFKRLGINAEINLEIERDELPTFGQEIYLWLPTVDNTCPSIDQLTVGTALIDQICKGMKKVYVHCKMGHGRSPTLVAAYLTRFRHMRVEEALEFIKKKRPEIHPNASQINGLLEFAKLWK
jgi:protein-tyrosine phosphatase